MQWTRRERSAYPPEPMALFFAIFRVLEMVISSGRSEPTVVIKLLPSPWKKKERAHGSFQVVGFLATILRKTQFLRYYSVREPN